MSWRYGVLTVVVWLGLCLSGPSWAGPALEAGERASQAGNLDEALAAYRQAVADEPGSALAHTRLGGILLLKQQYAGAIGSFKTAIGLDSDNADAFIGLGIAFLHQGEYGLARAALAEALQRKPSRKQEIDQVLVWLDAREGGAPAAQHP